MRYVAITACPTGIAHTYMAAEKLQAAAEAAGHLIKVETQGSIGVENGLSAADIAAADAVIIAADTNVVLDRFAGKRVLRVAVADGIHKPAELLERALAAPVQGGSIGVDDAAAMEPGVVGTLYRALMAGVSPMIPFVVVGGILIAVSVSLGGVQDATGVPVIPEGTFWWTMHEVGVLAFDLMIPVLSGYIARAIGDRPALAPGMVAGLVATHGELYDSEAGAGFLGAILAGFIAGYVVLGMKQVKVPPLIRSIMPVIILPLLGTIVASLLFVYVLGAPIAAVFTGMTNWLGGMTDANAVVLGIIIGLMITFDMGGPINKVAFLFGVGLLETGNTAVMGIVAACTAIPSCGQGVATLLRRKLYDEEEQELGYASIFMGLFGISEGAIPFAAADPARVIPANMIGGAVCGATAALFGIGNSTPVGGFLAVALGVVTGVAGYVTAMVVGTLATATITVGLKSRHAARLEARHRDEPEPTEVRTGSAGASATSGSPTSGTAGAAVTEPAGGVATLTAPAGLGDYITPETVAVDLVATDRAAAIGELVEVAARTGRVVDRSGLVSATLAREEQMSTGVGEGVATPHAKTDAVTEPVVVYARSAPGIPWDNVDGTPARDIFLIAVPERAAGDEHLMILSQLSRKLVKPQFRDQLRAASAEEALVLLRHFSS